MVSNSLMRLQVQVPRNRKYLILICGSHQFGRSGSGLKFAQSLAGDRQERRASAFHLLSLSTIARTAKIDRCFSMMNGNHLWSSDFISVLGSGTWPCLLGRILVLAATSLITRAARHSGMSSSRWRMRYVPRPRFEFCHVMNL